MHPAHLSKIFLDTKIIAFRRTSHPRTLAAALSWLEQHRKLGEHGYPSRSGVANGVLRIHEHGEPPVHHALRIERHGLFAHGIGEPRIFHHLGIDAVAVRP
jgi:hypothetical protein